MCAPCIFLRVQPKDSGEHKVVAVNSFGKAACSTKIVVKGTFNLEGIFFSYLVYFIIIMIMFFSAFFHRLKSHIGFMELFLILRCSGK